MQFFRLTTLCGVAIVLAYAPEISGQGLTEGQTKVQAIRLHDYVARVLKHNQSLEIQRLEWQISHEQALAEKGVFEPEVTGNYEYQDTKRPNTIEQDRNQGGVVDQFNQRNNIFGGGIESLVPSGGRVRMGFDMRQLRNNLQETGTFTRPSVDQEVVNFLGLSLVQPLLKNFGTSASMANIRLAATGSRIAFQDYRRQLMQITITAAALYWEMFFAEQQALLFDESVAVATTLLKDSRARAQVGKGSELDVQESEAGLAARLTRRNEAYQQLVETINRFIGLYAESVISSQSNMRTVDVPVLLPLELSYFNSYKLAFDNNPDYLVRRERIIMEDVRLAFAKNQRLPQLDLRTSMGLNGLGETFGDSWDDLGTSDFPAWTVGVEMRIPLGGGRRTLHELQAAKLRKHQALLGFKEIETQVSNALDTAIKRVESTRNGNANYLEVVDFYDRLLTSQIQSLELGKTDTQTVLETETRLFEAKNSQVQNLVQYKRALLELEMIEGTVLSNRHLDFTQAELTDRTEEIVYRLKNVGAPSVASVEALVSGSPPPAVDDRAREELVRELHRITGQTNLPGSEPAATRLPPPPASKSVGSKTAPAPSTPAVSPSADALTRELRRIIEEQNAAKR